MVMIMLVIKMGMSHLFFCVFDRSNRCVVFQSAERLAGAQTHRKIPNLEFTIEIHMQATQQANRDTNMHL